MSEREIKRESIRLAVLELRRLAGKAHHTVRLGPLYGPARYENVVLVAHMLERADELEKEVEGLEKEGTEGE